VRFIKKIKINKMVFCLFHDTRLAQVYVGGRGTDIKVLFLNDVLNCETYEEK
jgi:hypothetical protein